MRKMENKSSVSEFRLLEFSSVRELQILYFLVFLVLYLVTVSGNLLIITAIAVDPYLHTPMYFFLMNLAMQDIGSVSVIVPKAMFSSIMKSNHISYSGCVAQVLLFVFFVGSDIALLTVMAYDRYVAICNPLHYEMVMNWRACTKMMVSAWISGLLNAMLQTGGTFASPFCSNVVNQFFCEIPHLLELACSGLHQIEIGAVLFSIIIGLGCFIFIVVTYISIFRAVLKIPSVQGRKKAFSTCLPHLIVFSTFLFTVSFAYLRPPSERSSYLDLVFTMLYSIVPPLINPVIYSMRNKEMKNAFSKLLVLRHSFMDTFSSLGLQRKILAVCY